MPLRRRRTNDARSHHGPQRPGEKPPFFWALLAAALAVFAASYAMFAYEYSFPFMDLYIHANLASEFDFADLHSITCRLSYPMWHVFVSALYQLGVPLSIAAAGMCALCKTLVFVLTCLLVHAMGGKRRTALIVSLLLMVVTGILIPSVNPRVYRTIGSPNVWHNPTQQIVTAAMLMVMPWLAHCWYEFERRLTAGEKDYAALGQGACAGGARRGQRGL